MPATNTSARNDHERKATIFDDLAVRFQVEQAGGAIPSRRFVKIATDGHLEVAGMGDSVVGVYPGVNDLVENAPNATVQFGRTFVIADGVVTAGQPVKAGAAGRAIRFVTSSLAGTTIEDNVGLAFTNQPANDGVEMVSDNVADTTQSVTLYYTRTGQGNTVYTEAKTLNGTTQVAFTHTDIALVLAIVKSAATAGTLTVREASGNATIKTLNAATNSSGYIAVTSGQENAYNTAPTAVASIASTKTIGIIGTDESDAVLRASIPLTGTSPVTFPDTFKTVTFLLVGDVESTVTATVKVGAQDSLAVLAGVALSTSDAQGDPINVLVLPSSVTPPSSSETPTANVGYANAGTTAVEYGDSRNHVTVLTVSTTLPAIAGGANLGVGKLLYTMPAGAVAIMSAKMALAITQSQGNITADTPDGGLGSVIASGVVATLDGTPTFEDILTGQTFNDCNGTVETKTVANQPMVMESGAAHTVHFNVADGWAASGDAAAGLAGTVILAWTYLG